MEGLNLHVSALRPLRLKPEISEIHVSLVFPASWKTLPHPASQKLEDRTSAWLHEIGVVHNEEQEEKLRKMKASTYAGWPFSECSEERLEIIMRFLSLWIFYDDAIEEQDDGLSSEIQAAVGGQTPSLRRSNPHYRGWWELGQSYGQAMSPVWMERHARLYGEWQASVAEEFLAASRLRKEGSYPNAAEHLRCRTTGIGMIPLIDFVEYAIDWELPKSLYESSEMQTIWRLTAEIVAIFNDVYSFNKDRSIRWSNIVSCLAAEFKVPLEDAFHWTVAMHNARVVEMERTELALLAKASDREGLQAWL
ncbi:MAG TPA: terpene synthase family protein, partial [bacterium]|nr:terpene synthase family protein [bacterium]